MHTLNDSWSYEELIEHLDKPEVNKLSIILSRLEFGDDKVLITPVGERVGPEVIFAEWDSALHHFTSQIKEIVVISRS